MSDTNEEAFKEMEERLKRKEFPKPNDENDRDTIAKAIPAVIATL